MGMGGSSHRLGFACPVVVFLHSLFLHPLALLFCFSSLLSNVSALAGIILAISLPLFGSIVDHTRQRKNVGIYTSLLAIVINAAQIAVSPATWPYMAGLQVIAWALFAINNTAVYAYASELAPDDAEKQTRYNTEINTSLYAAILLFLIVVLAPSIALDLGDIDTARIAQAVAAVVAGIFFFAAWKYCMPECPARRPVPEGSSLLSAGFKKIYGTMADIIKSKRNPYLKWMMLSIMLAESASTSIVTISTTYQKEVLRNSSTEIGITAVVVLLFGIPGNWIGQWISIRSRSPVRSTQICDGLFALTTIAAAFHLRGPDDKPFVFIYAALWGISLGWMPPVHATSFMLLAEKGAEAEMMGIFLFSVDIITFLPPLVFTLTNEAGLAMNLGLGSLSIYFLLAIMLLFPIGRLEDAMKRVRALDMEKIQENTAESDPESGNDDQ